ncbi:hypothetical protein [Rhodococcus opacus]|uniref:hypothetical protein n=1 Tax=Rhodococcus opacus TaxID=37919 RepID=UPI002474F30D|nr:hypothetical protein [Rhodococcus opacus]MDH6291831.1 hypothetical protein [Rhodococcus opacus]
MNGNLETPDAAVLRAQLTRALIPSRGRIDTRADEARRFERWRLEPSQPDITSSIVADDRDGFSETITEKVTETPVFDHALFPAMSAAENLTTVVNMIDNWDENGQIRTVSLITLCRSALESSARTVWILAPEGRTQRRERALRVTKTEVLGQKKYLTAELERTDPSIDRNRLIADLDAAKAVLNELDDVKPAILHEQAIDYAAKWIDDNSPNTANTPMAPVSRSMYSIASGIAHGYQWATTRLRTPTDLMNLVADFLYAANTMTGAAVLLYEAQAAASEDIGDNCPPHLRAVAGLFHKRYPPSG